MSGARFPVLALAVVLVAFVLYAAADASVLTLVLGVPLAGAGWWLSEGRRRWSLPRSVVGVLVVAALLNALRTVTFDGLDVTDFCIFVVLVVLIKMFDRKSARDWAQILTLSAFLGIGAILTSNELATGVLLVAFVPLLVFTVVEFQFYAGVQGVASWREEIAPAGVEPPALRPARGRGSRRALAGVHAFTLVAGAVISVGVFLAVPRGLGAEAFGNWTPARTGARTGFADTVQLGGSGLISQSQEIVLDLVVEDTEGTSVGSPSQVYYLRGAVLDEYENGRWRRSDEQHDRLKRVRVTAGDNFRFPMNEAQRVDLVQTITLRNAPRERSHLFAAWKPTSIRLLSDGELVYNPRELTFARSGSPGKYRYVVESARQIRIPQGDAPLEDGLEAVEFASEAIESLARERLAEARVPPEAGERTGGDNSRAARAFENWMRSEFSYTLEMTRPREGVDPIEWFLVESRSGHCEYFASGMVALCRSVGIPARIVTGYVAAEWNEGSRHYVVRESNAHAWVEVEVKPGVWRTYDPTPPGDLIELHRPREGLVASVRRMLDAVEYAWITSVVGFDERTRVRLVGGPTADIRAGGDGGRRREVEAADAGRRLRLAVRNGAIAFCSTAGGGLLVALVAWRARSREEVAAWAGEGESAALLRQQSWFYGELLEALRARGAAKPAHAPPLAHARRLAAVDPQLSGAAARLSERFYQLRFGRTPLGEAELERVREDLRAIAASPGARGQVRVER